MSPLSPENHDFQIERAQLGPVRELALKFNKDTTVSPHPHVVQSFLTPPQSPAVVRGKGRSAIPRETFLTPLQSPKINLVAQRASTFGKELKAGKRPSFIQKDPHNPFNNSMLWNTDESISIDDPELLVAETMPVVGSARDYEKVFKEDDQTSVTVPSDDSFLINLDDSTATRDDALLYKQHDHSVEVRKVKSKAKKDQKDVKKSKKSDKDATNSKAKSPKSKQKRVVFSGIAPLYPSWDFGKVKKIELPPVSSTTIHAAIIIQRMMRGWWRRLNFRVQLLTYRLENRERLTSEALERVWNDTEAKKNKFYDIMKGKMDRRQDREIEKKVTCRSQGQQIIEYLRKDNKKIREDTDRIKRKFREQKEKQLSLEAASEQIAQNMEVLQVHTKRFQETHNQLARIEPVYQDKVATLEDSYAQAKAYCDTEHICKLKYLNAMEKIVTMVQDRCTNRKLVDKVVDLMLSIDVDE
ncbi:hypothetical protein FisN_15Lh042 [Fistulifera solaris]|uniref:Uncharacterized protein n=1 Tax=Fistulifera solaris TaxID=1519565 RepID=A0A1Z5KH90_FISSO|nr:hypothetical protein FisN_15Lh042 [Fistulifera solaris]|eukprot:GAX25673.1 hypothetical protein FisN_15Lh042 [Fistulifera solaris]